MKWDFKNLRSYKGCVFTYNASGLRQTKTKGFERTKYFWAGDKLIGERRSVGGFYIPQGGMYIPQGGIHIRENHVYIDYVYGVTGVIGFTVQKGEGVVEKYWYTKNMQGDVTHIHDSNGVLKAEYQYDAWGNQTILVNVNDIANINTIRYRGYYWDAELGLYYLQSRYYDPEVCRFISPDIVEILNFTKNHVNGLNLYIYCGNDPVNYTDSTGLFPVANAFARIKWTPYQLTNNPVIANLFGNVSYSIIEQDKKAGLLHAYSMAGLNGQMIGVGTGFNLFGVLGAGVTASATSFWDARVGASVSVGPFSIGANIGLLGVGVDFGFGWGNTTHELSINVGIGTALLVAGTAALIVAAPVVVASVATAAVIVTVVGGVQQAGNSVSNFFKKLKFW
jgi:RHS repeat-associated protein